ncbi:extracellular solute-binding protein [Microcoleus sp. N9_B1]|uniref:extracellular solute-binding protein n=2 Tax=Microcoleus TaxID=44471 RepID=UPI002FD448FE
MIFSWQQRLHSWRKPFQYLAVMLTALWLSIAVPGCSFFQSNPPTLSSPGLTPTTSIATTLPPQRFDGVTINVVTNPGGLNLADGRNIAGFEALTGAKIDLKEVPFINYRNLLQKNWSGNASEYDLAIILPQWQIDFADAGYIEDLTDRRKSDPALEWDDIAPLFRDFSANYKGRTYTIPLDGDFHMVYYRTDLLKQAGLKPPETWDDYLAVAKQFHGKDLNGDGEPDYGSCIPKVANEISTTFLGSFFAPFLQSQGTAQGIFFDPETMKPLVNNPGFAKALEIYKQTMKYGVPDDQNLNLATARKIFLSGRCAMTLDWGDIGPFAIDKAVSKVTDKVGASITPGTTQVLDRKTNKLVACDKFTCPYAIGGVNHAPYAANGGWVGVVAAKSPPKVKDAAYAFLSYMSQPAQANINVTHGNTGLNPYRISQFKNSDPWIKSGMSFTAANNYLGAIGVSLSSPNMVLDLKIPKTQEYINFLDTVRADFLADKITKQEAMQRIEQGWEEITNAVGRDSQKTVYRSSLGLQS